MEDKAHGFGKYMHVNGSVYSGMWVEDKQHGEGVEQWPGGVKYTGQFE